MTSATLLYNIRRAASVALLSSAAVALSGCHHIDDDRIPPVPVRIVFSNVGEWNTYGVGGALDNRRFIREESSPAGFPYTAMTYTGFGGVLLAGSVTGEPLAYDLSCPVECKQDVRIFINEQSRAECPKCHSEYEVFTNFGYPVSGEAAEKGYGLARYRVVPGSQGEYMMIIR